MTSDKVKVDSMLKSSFLEGSVAQMHTKQS